MLKTLFSWKGWKKCQNIRNHRQLFVLVYIARPIILSQKSFSAQRIPLCSRYFLLSIKFSIFPKSSHKKCLITMNFTWIPSVASQMTAIITASYPSLIKSNVLLMPCHANVTVGLPLKSFGEKIFHYCSSYFLVQFNQYHIKTSINIEKQKLIFVQWAAQSKILNL